MEQFPAIDIPANWTSKQAGVTLRRFSIEFPLSLFPLIMKERRKNYRKQVPQINWEGIFFSSSSFSLYWNAIFENTSFLPTLQFSISSLKIKLENCRHFFFGGRKVSVSYRRSLRSGKRLILIFAGSTCNVAVTSFMDEWKVPKTNLFCRWIWGLSVGQVTVPYIPSINRWHQRISNSSCYKRHQGTANDPQERMW